MTTVVAELSEDIGRIVLTDETGNQTSWSKKHVIEQIPGKRWNRTMKRWTLPLSWAACVQARAFFGADLKVGPKLGDWARDKRDQRGVSMYLRDRMHLDPNERSPYANAHDTVLYPFQIPGRDFLITAKHALLGDEMGSGKTLQTLAALRATDAYPALVVCPNSVKRNWEREIRKWLPEANPIVVTGSSAKRRKILTEAADVERAVIIINIEAVRLHSRLSPYGPYRLKKCIECDPKEGDAELTAAKCETHAKELNTFDFRTCILDEAHRVKDPRALQTRAVWAVFHALSVEYRWALTGTPVANSPIDIWSILHTIMPEDFAAKTAFLDRYADIEFNAFGGIEHIELNEHTKEEFFSLIDPHFRRMLKSQVLRQLPEKTFITRDVEMKPKQRKVYESMDDAAIAVLNDEGNQLVASNSLAAATRLLQFASAFCEVDTDDPKYDPEKPETWKVTMIDPSPKVDELMSIIEDNPGKPLAIAAEHRQLIDLAAARLTDAGIEFGRITGGVSADERDANVEAFQAGKLDYLLFTYKAGGVGLNLTRADTLVRLQRSWSLVDNQQGVDRVHRIGSEIHESVNIIDIVTAGTIEERQLSALHAKAERAESIVRDRERTHQDIDVDTELTKNEVHADNAIDGGP